MISVELLRRYPFFGSLNEKHLREIAMISEEITIRKGDIVLTEGQKAENLFLIISGGIELSYKSEAEFHPKSTKVFSVGEINPGELFGISSIIEPHISTATATANVDSKLIKVNGDELLELIKDNDELGCSITSQIAKLAIERLNFTRYQLAAAWA